MGLILKGEGLRVLQLNQSLLLFYGYHHNVTLARHPLNRPTLSQFERSLFIDRSGGSLFLSQ